MANILKNSYRWHKQTRGMTGAQAIDAARRMLDSVRADCAAFIDARDTAREARDNCPTYDSASRDAWREGYASG